MADRVGTSSGSLSSSTGGVTDELGNQLLGTSTAGGGAQSLGPQLAREIVAGIPNGDVSLAPENPDAPISDANQLPFWTLVNPAPDFFLVEAVESTAQASGYTIQVTIKPGAPSGAAGDADNTVYLERYIPVAASYARSFTYEPRAHWSGSSGASSANIRAWAEGTYTTRALATTGAAGTNSAVLTGLDRELQVKPGDGYAIAADAGYIRYRTGVTVTGAITVTETATLREVRVDRGTVQNLVTDQTDPGTYRGGDYINGGTHWFAVEGSGRGPAFYVTAASGSSPTGNGWYNFYNAAPYGGTYHGAATNAASGTATKLDISARDAYAGSMPAPASDQVVPPAGLYLIVARVSWASDGTGYRRIFLDVDGVAQSSSATGTGASISYNQTLSTVQALSGTQAVSVRGQQNSGSTLTGTVSELTLVRLGAAW